MNFLRIRNIRTVHWVCGFGIVPWGRGVGRDTRSNIGTHTVDNRSRSLRAIVSGSFSAHRLIKIHRKCKLTVTLTARCSCVRGKDSIRIR